MNEGHTLETCIIVLPKCYPNERQFAEKKLAGQEKCSFCSGSETINHLFFDCSMASYVWSLVAIVLGSPLRRTSMDQFWVWINNCLLNEKQFHMMGLAAILWALWRARNNACFEKKLTRSLTETVCSVCSSIVYWAGLQKGDDQKQLGRWCVGAQRGDATLSSKERNGKRCLHNPSSLTQDGGI